MVAHPAHRGTIHVEDARILARHAFADRQYAMRLAAPQTAAHATPGSFVHIAVDPSVPMRRPLSIMRADADEGWIEVQFRLHGPGLQHLAARPVGETVNLLGPIGQGFRLDAARPHGLLVGSGHGAPPLVFLAERMRDRQDEGFRPFVLLGSEVSFPFVARPSTMMVDNMPPGVIAAMPLLEDWGVPSRLASPAGFPGCHDGAVIELARLWVRGLDDTGRAQCTIYCAGPATTTRAVVKLAREFGLPCQVALEETMVCAVGGCAGCAVEVMTPEGPAMKRVCVDGPVFDAQNVFLNE